MLKAGKSWPLIDTNNKSGFEFTETSDNSFDQLQDSQSLTEKTSCDANDIVVGTSGSVVAHNVSPIHYEQGIFDEKETSDEDIPSHLKITEISAEQVVDIVRFCL